MDNPQFIWFPISILTSIRYCLFYSESQKYSNSINFSGKFRQRLLCAAQSDKPQLPHRASSKPKGKEMPINGNPIGYKSQSQSHHPINTQHTIFKYSLHCRATLLQIWSSKSSTGLYSDILKLIYNPNGLTGQDNIPWTPKQYQDPTSLIINNN